ncbi:OOP family OmpA-OmpF porin [Mucilaginibacter yixingensis]|uniref:OOP family OmpA-OmpF porin n=1 Tax=Mucilaginibacter yixingensis TaxID=1295612 RepID=A0A2T5JBY4_9SPHI|nr:OmpA family protein [Mucilaginibacter yixingensis]PTQ99283.1 OOP family OmpA-OmpF porin [Mucilaginibacter yixingensis]
MNYSTLKKTVALSFVAAMAVGMAKAQSTDSTTTTAKVFGGRGQYNTWNIGVNVGVTSPFVAIGGSNDFTNWKGQLGYGVSVRNQLAHSFGLQLDVRGGKVAGDNSNLASGQQNGFRDFSTQFWSATLGGVVNVATIDYIRRKNAVNFFVTAGAGLAWYNPTGTLASGAHYDWKATSGHDVKELVIPIGAGVKFRLTDAVALNLGYTANFYDGDNFDGNKQGFPTKDKSSYGYAGLEFTLGPKSKPNLDWVNPVAMMYDELYDAALRQEVAALKSRVSNVENAVNDLKKDSDGDGVSDQFDKCPNTPAGTVVDGAGCEIKFPKDTVTATAPVAAAYSNIQFDFDSSVLRTSSYPALDATSADLRSATGTVWVNGFASSEGTAAHNMQLSKDRANSVKTYLVNSGVDAKRVKVKGYGETKPIADNSTEEGRVLNRRVEFKK